MHSKHIKCQISEAFAIMLFKTMKIRIWYPNNEDNIVVSAMVTICKPNQSDLF